MTPDLLAEIRTHGDVPAHVAIIMDGNGRWARQRGRPREFGHRAGMVAVREAVEGAIAVARGRELAVDALVFTTADFFQFATNFHTDVQPWERPDTATGKATARSTPVLRLASATRGGLEEGTGREATPP